VLRTHADPDLWGHVRFGLDALRDRQLTTTDPYSFTQDVPWVNHEWLSEVAMGAAFTAGGGAGLMLLKGVVVLMAFAVVWHALKGADAAWRWGGLAIATVVAHPLTVTIRPQIWTLLLLVALCRLLVIGGRAYWMVPLLFVPWANFHGGWILGLGVVAAWSAGQVLDRAPRSEMIRLAVVLLLSVAATAINPYGWHLWEFIASTVRLSRADISEWQPIWRHSASAVVSWMLSVSFVALSWRRHGRPGWSELLVLLMLAVASLRVMRLVALFAPAAVLLLAPRFPRNRGPGVPRPQTVVDILVVSVAIAGSLQARIMTTCPSIEGPAAPDMTSLGALARAEPSGRLITPFDWGQAALWAVGPDLKVSIDGRRETVYSTMTREAQYAIQRGTAEGLQALERLAPDYVWLPLRGTERTRAWLLEHGFRIDVLTPAAFVAAKNAHPVVPASAISIASQCFPGLPARASVSMGKPGS
jgi:hypothetical protein